MTNVISKYSRAATLATLLLCGAASAQQATSFRIKQIIVQGDQNVQASSVNADGTVVGTLYAGITDAATGIAIAGAAVTTLPNPAGGDWLGFHPAMINDKGDILGWSRHAGALNQTTMFLLQNGSFNDAYDQLLIAPGSQVSSDNPLPLSLSNNLQVSFNTLYGLSTPVGTSYGVPPHFKSVPQMNRFTHVNSINNFGIVAGITYSFNGITAVYTGKGHSFITLSPPDAANTTGGWINNAGTVAGSFRDTAGAWHGFTYAGGSYTVFDMPEAAFTITTDAITKFGRVVGSYLAANGQQRAFLYNGKTVTAFGAYPSSDAITVAIGNRGAMAVAEQISAPGPKYRSWLVTCSGSGC